MEGLGTTMGACQRGLEYGCGGRKLAIWRARCSTECDVLLDDVLTRRDVRGLDERQHMSVRVHDVGPGEQECHPLHPPLAAQYRRQPLADCEDLMRDRRRQRIEVREVLARDYLYVTGANRMDVEEGDDVGGLVDDVRMDSAIRNSAEEAVSPAAHGTLRST